MQDARIDELLNTPVDYEKQSLVSKDMNPYEVAVAAARYARNLNDRVRKYYGPEVNIHPRNIAVKKLEIPGTRVVYREGPQKAPEARKD